MDTRPSAGGSLIVVGIGIEWASQTTIAVRGALEAADRVLFAVANPWAARWIRTLNVHAEALPYPKDGRRRSDIYREMVERILGALRQGLRVCAAFYGHPGFLVEAGHEAIRRARAEGHHARMLPGVSSLDCLFADLGIDPGAQGCQLYEASAFMARHPAIDPTTPLVLHQIALIDNRLTYDGDASELIARGLTRLRDHLRSAYPAEHQVIIYEAATHPLHPPRLESVQLHTLADAAVTEVSTLYVPALRPGQGEAGTGSRR
jgi:uncharacterized protein YabN with tetrapyrrole methylase and pyrophosphatase domain